jgi:hypothetical protein
MVIQQKLMPGDDSDADDDDDDDKIDNLIRKEYK